MNNMILGFDLGTTYSAVAYVDEHGEAKIIPNSASERITPSVVFFEKEDNIIVGQNAKDEIELSPEKVISFVKREMGKNKDNVRANENYGIPKPYDFFEKRYSPEEISGFILKKLKEDAESFLGQKPINNAIITVPAYFNEFERNATIKAGEFAGLNVLKVINEPTAGALSYGIQFDKNQKVFVFDLGGGTFDVTIIEIFDGQIKVLASDGDHRLGGKDWDDKIIEYIANEFINQFGEDPRDDSDAMAELRLKSEKIKKKLSQKDSTRIIVRTSNNSLKIDISRDRFEELCSDLLSRIEGLCDSVLNQVNLNWGNISEIVLAGGSTRLQMVRNLLELISNKKLRTDLVNPDECVALGAALQGVLLNTGNRLSQNFNSFGRIKSIEDVASHSLGFVTIKENKLHNSIMIKKNSPLPCKITKQDFTNSRDNQDILEVIVLQGESINPNNCTILYGYEFQELPKAKMGDLNIQVSFEYNINNIVEVNAKIGNNNLPYKKILNPSLPNMEEQRKIPLSVILSIDLSGSMYGAPLEEAKNAAIEFIKQMDFSYTSIGLIPFADRVEVIQTFSKNQLEIEKKIKNLNHVDLGGGTSAEPFEKSLEIMKFEEGKKLIIVLTDGAWFNKNIALKNAQNCKYNGIEIRAIGFGSADINFLKQLSTSEDGYNFTRSGEELTQALLNIATEISTNKLKSN